MKDSILSHKPLEYPTEQVGGFRDKLQEKERVGIYESVQGLQDQEKPWPEMERESRQNRVT